MSKLKLLTVIPCILVAFLFTSAHAMTDATRSQFDTIMDMPLKQLGQLAAKVLEEKYPNEDWTAHKFPNYVYNDMETEMAYRVAVKNHRLLGIVNVSNEDVVIPCYCTCDSFGHDNLLYCFYKNGDSGNGFDEHGAQCAVCIRQALLAFLWDHLGATHEEIMAGMKKKFAPLIEKYHQHDH